MASRGSCFRIGVSTGLAAVAGLGLSTMSDRAAAADLRVSYAELASVVQTVVGGAKIHLDNKPGGILSFGASSYVSLGSQQVAIPLPAKSFQVLGSTYAYYVSDINSQSVRASAVTGAVRLTVSFESDGSEMVSGCVQGSCAFEEALPNIEWSQPAIAIDVVPVAYNGSVALKVVNVEFGGTLRAVCQDSADFFLAGACEAGLSWANRSIAKLKPELAAQIKDKMNAPELQQSIANDLKKYLTIGSAGSVSISKVSAGDSSVTITFALSTASN